jgi:ubiquinone/menaquinone biosynthesis C-methylase UbiE
MNESHSTLLLIEKMDKYNAWVYSKFLKYNKGKILEIGCGIGTVTQYYINNVNSFDVTVIDISEEYVNIVKQRFDNCKNFKAYVADIAAKVDILEENGYDTIICSNVLEHIQNDSDAIANMSKLLKKNGLLVLLVPTCNFLFSSLDKNLGHCRRYSRMEIKNKLEKAGLVVEKQFYVNIFGVFGWFFNGKILRKKVLDRKLMVLFNFFTPLFIFIERIFKFSFGLSLISICRKIK